MHPTTFAMHPDAEARFAMLDRMFHRLSLNTISEADREISPVVHSGSQSSHGGVFPHAELSIRLASK